MHLEKNNVKIGRKMTKLCQFNVLVPKWHLAYFVPIDGHFGQIVRYGLQICFAKYLLLFGFWAQNLFGGLYQKSALISMCKIHIYIDSERFRKIH